MRACISIIAPVSLCDNIFRCVFACTRACMCGWACSRVYICARFVFERVMRVCASVFLNVCAGAYVHACLVHLSFIVAACPLSDNRLLAEIRTSLHDWLV